MGKTTLKASVLEDVYLLPIFGGDPDEQDNPDDNKPDPDDDGDDDGDDGDDDEDRSKWTPEQTREHELRGEAARRRKERNAERKARLAAEARVKELEGKGKSTEDKLTAELAKANASLESLTAAGTKNVLRTAIMEHDKFKWHDVGDVMKELNMDDLEVNVEDHEVDGLESQLKDLAKRKPYLLKTKESEDQEPAPRGPSGHQPRKPRQAGTNGQLSREELRAKYKVLDR